MKSGFFPGEPGFLDRILHAMIGHHFDPWMAKRSGRSWCSFRGYRQRRCYCGKIEAEWTDSYLTFDSWIDEVRE